jgi:cytochrome b561
MKLMKSSSQATGNVTQLTRSSVTRSTRSMLNGPDAATGKHAPATIALHWATVMAVVVVVAAIYLRETTEEKWIRQAFLDLHRQLGLLIIVGLVLRLAVRFTVGMADHTKDMPALMRWAAWLAHIALYAMLLAVPVLGWAASNAHDVKLNFLGTLPLPNLVKADSDLSDTLDDYHKWSTWAMGVLVLMHIGAALWHHHVRKDGVLKAMLPNRRA